MTSTNTSTPVPMNLARAALLMSLAGNPSLNGGRLWRGVGIGFGLAQSFQVLHRQDKIIAPADHQRRQSVPLVHDLQINVSGVLLQGLAADADGLRFTLGFDDRGVRLDLRPLLEIL